MTTYNILTLSHGIWCAPDVLSCMLLRATLCLGILGIPWAGAHFQIAWEFLSESSQYGTYLLAILSSASLWYGPCAVTGIPQSGAHSLEVVVVEGAFDDPMPHNTFSRYPEHVNLPAASRTSWTIPIHRASETGWSMARGPILLTQYAL